MSLCFVWFVVSTPVFRNGAGRQVYMFIALSGLVSLVWSGMCCYVDIHTRWPATFLKKGVDTKIKYTGDETDPQT